MNRVIGSVLFVVTVNLCHAQSYAPSAGQFGTTAVHKDSSIISSWAVSCSITRGLRQIDHPEFGYVDFGIESEALGYAEGNSINVVSLGDGGSALLGFNPPIKNGPGNDFAIFENGFDDNYMELAFVEVSSNGVDFYRFPSYSETPSIPQISNAGYGNCQYIHNLAGKYRQGYGTPFDLNDLDSISGLDMNSVTHIRLIDVVGFVDSVFGTLDSQGRFINDPFPTNFDSGGFDLDGVAVINQGELNVGEQQLTFVIYPNPFVNLINIEVEEESLVSVLSISGSVVYNEIVSDKSVFDLQGLSKGMYFLIIENYNEKSSLKIVKH